MIKPQYPQNICTVLAAEAAPTEPDQGSACSESAMELTAWPATHAINATSIASEIQSSLSQASGVAA